MSTSVLDRLQELRPDSKIRLTNSLPTAFSLYLQNNKGVRPLELVYSKMIANAHWTSVPYKGGKALLQKQGRQAIRKVMTLQPGFESNFTYSLNTALLGGNGYPVLTAVLGTAAGIASFGAGLFFAAATTGISMSQKARRVLARGGDEIWQVEEIGRVRDGSGYKAMHVNSYFIVDPYRRQSFTKGWLIHEERSEVTLG